MELEAGSCRVSVRDDNGITGGPCNDAREADDVARLSQQLYF